MARKRTTGGTPATTALEAAGVEHVLHAYGHDARAVADGGSYGAEAAQALGQPPERVFKTLLAEAPGVPGGLVVAVVPVSGQLDLKALARHLGVARATLADPVRAERATGYVVGGISPLGQKRAHRTVVDETALVHPTILVSAGRRGLDVELAAADLVRVTGATTCRVGR